MTMASRLLNVRLGPDDERVVRQLRTRGVSISDVVRRALRAEGDKAPVGRPGLSRLFDEMLSRYPTPPGAVGRRPKTTDRRAVSTYIRNRLRRRP